MAERARSRSSLDEESQAGIISFVHRLPGEIPLTGRAEELAEASASAVPATTLRSGALYSLKTSQPHARSGVGHHERESGSWRLRLVRDDAAPVVVTVGRSLRWLDVWLVGR